jgi:alcohol dehydrogenase YqhD (iron-dependent ADH family)
MENFVAYNPTQLHFGKDVIAGLGNAVKNFGLNVLLVYGKGSVVKYGYYDKTVAQLKAIGANIFEYNGIRPNPVVEDVIECISKNKENKIDVIVALGGGSVIDSAKIIAACYPENLDVWSVMKYKTKPSKALPLIAILTLAATGSEMNAAAVLQNSETKEKTGYFNPLTFPKYAFLDPQFTYSVPATYTAYGITDLIAHALEGYFGDGDARLTDKIVFEIIKEAMTVAPKVLKEPENYEYRAAIMWAATLALNGTTAHGRKSGDWGVHGIGHVLSLLFDTPHGASLSIVYPAWIKLHYDRIPERIKYLGENLFGVSSLYDTVKKLEDFFTSINSPIRLKQIGLGEKDRQAIKETLMSNRVSGMINKLTNDDYDKLISFMI